MSIHLNFDLSSILYSQYFDQVVSQSLFVQWTECQTTKDSNVVIVSSKTNF